MSSNTCFSGLVEFLQSKQGVKEVELRPGRPASDVDISTWEKRYSCVLPEDVKIFYLTHNGLKLQWTCLHQGATVPVGRIHIASLGDLRPLVPAGGEPQSGSFPSLADLDPDEVGWVPSLCSSDDKCSVMVLDFCATCGHTCLMLPHQEPPPQAPPTTSGDASDANTNRGGSVWLLDLALSWHQLSPTFSDYLRLATVHLGLRQWPYALTTNRLSPQYEYWFSVFAPHRLEMDQTHLLPPTTRQTLPTQGREKEEGETAGLNVVDVSTILAAKTSRQKSGAIGRLKSGGSSRGSSQSSTASRRSASSTNKTSVTDHN